MSQATDKPGVIDSPHVTTDRTVDTWSPERMVASLVKPGMTNQEKALAIYQFVRRTMFHYRYNTKVAGGGVMDLINGIGYCLCTPTAGTQARLCTLAGLKGMVLGTPGHGSVSVGYDDAWHWMDAFLGGCVWNADRSALAGLEAINTDPSLLTRDTPSPVPLFPCRDVLLADALRFEPDNQTYHAECSPDDATWAASAIPGKREPMFWDDESSLAITLRPGERYERRWDHEPGMYFLFKTPERFAPPHHFCGIEAEQRDTVNWPYWEPYVKPITSFDPKTGKRVTVRTGRYWANGRLTWTPTMTPAMLKTAAAIDNLTVEDGLLRCVDPGKPGRLDWDVRCPFILQGGWLRLTGEGTPSAFLTPTAKQADRMPLTWKQTGDQREAELRSCLATAVGCRGYTLSLELTGTCRISALELVTVFQHNMHALPQLMPGDNRLRVTVGAPTQLENARLVLDLAWEERPSGRQRILSETIQASPHETLVTIPGRTWPRMVSMAFRNVGSEQES